MFPECLLNFLRLPCSNMCGKNFQYMVFTFPENHGIYACPFRKSVSPKTEGVDEAMHHKLKTD